MKRLHVHVAVSDLDRAREYYSTMFGEAPVVEKDDYLKWAPSEPPVNFAVSSGGCESVGISHLGVELDSEDAVNALSRDMDAINAPLREDGKVSCCYAMSDKAWSEDPAGIKWEMFHTYGDSDHLAADLIEETPAAEKGCCA